MAHASTDSDSGNRPSSPSAPPPADDGATFRKDNPPAPADETGEAAGTDPPPQPAPAVETADGAREEENPPAPVAPAASEERAPSPLVRVKREKVSVVVAEEDQLRQLLERPTIYPPNAPPHPGSVPTSRARFGGQQTISSYFGSSKGKDGDELGAGGGDDKEDKTPAIDLQSLRGVFGWTTLEGVHIPFILRLGEEKFTAVRIIERTLLKRYLQALHPDVYSCTYIKSYFITDNEAVLLNEINMRHCDRQYGPEPFTSKDLVVQLDDVEQLYEFLSTCHRKLNHKPAAAGASGAADRRKDERCGVVGYSGGTNTTTFLPYVRRRNGVRYAPMALVERLLASRSVLADQLHTEKLEPWEMSYVKFCCKVAGLAHDFLEESDSCPVVALDDLTRRTTSFSEWWPSSPAERSHLTAQQQQQQQQNHRQNSSVATSSSLSTGTPMLYTYSGQRKFEPPTLAQATTVDGGRTDPSSSRVAASAAKLATAYPLPRAVPASGYADGSMDGSGRRSSSYLIDGRSSTESSRSGGAQVSPAKAASGGGKIGENGVVDFSVGGSAHQNSAVHQLSFPMHTALSQQQQQQVYGMASSRAGLASSSPSPQAFIYNGQWWGPVNARSMDARCYPTSISAHCQPLVAAAPYPQSPGSAAHQLQLVSSQGPATTMAHSSLTYSTSPVVPSPTTPQHLTHYAQSISGQLNPDLHHGMKGTTSGLHETNQAVSRQSLEKRRSSFAKVNGNGNIQYPVPRSSSSSSTSTAANLVYQPPPLIRVQAQIRNQDYGQCEPQHHSSFSKPPPPLVSTSSSTGQAPRISTSTGLTPHRSKHGTGLGGSISNGTVSPLGSHLGYPSSAAQHLTNGVSYQLARQLASANGLVTAEGLRGVSGGRESFVVAPGNHHHHEASQQQVVGKMSSPKPANQVPTSMLGGDPSHHPPRYHQPLQHQLHSSNGGGGVQSPASRGVSVMPTLSHAEALTNFLQLHANGVIAGTNNGQFAFTSKLHELLQNAKQESQLHQRTTAAVELAQQSHHQRAGEYRDHRITASPPRAGSSGGGGASAGPSYKVQQVMILGTKYRCINSIPREYTTALMVPVQELAQNTKPRASLQRCKDILTSVFGVRLFDCNRLQEEVMRKHINGLKEGTPVTLICTDDMIKYLPQLSYTLAKLGDAKEKEREPVSKRARMETQVNS